MIDFHVHTYSPKIAKRTVEHLAKVGGSEAYTDGTPEDTYKKLIEWGIERAVHLPIATNIKQQEMLNSQASELNCFRTDEGGKFWYPYGTVAITGEPYGGAEYAGFDLNPIKIFNTDNTQKFGLLGLEQIKSYGLYGVKLHPDYQGFFLFEERIRPIIKRAGELNLPVMIHMGHEPASLYSRHSTPVDLKILAEMYPETMFIGAHLGGMFDWAAAAYHLKNLDNVYIDTAMIAKWCPKELCRFVIKEIGADRVIFGSDCPFSPSVYSAEYILELDISEREKELILSENAERLLGI